LGVAIRQVDRSDQHSVDRRFDVSRLAIRRITRQGGAREHQVAIPRQDRYPVPRAFTNPDSTIAEVPKGRCRKGPLLYFELLEANDIGLGPFEPSRQIVQPLVAC